VASWSSGNITRWKRRLALPASRAPSYDDAGRTSDHIASRRERLDVGGHSGGLQTIDISNPSAPAGAGCASEAVDRYADDGQAARESGERELPQVILGDAEYGFGGAVAGRLERLVDCRQQVGPSELPALQTGRWLRRPIAFLESCRRHFGDTFSVRFVGMRTPLVMISDPAAVRALYSECENRLPPGRTFALRPLVGGRSILLQEGAEHLQRRRLMLPAFHGERMRAYEDLVAEVAERELERCPLGRPFVLHPYMQHVTLEVILTAVFAVSDAQRLERLRRLVPQLLDATSTGMQLRMLTRRIRDAGPVPALRALIDEIDAELFAGISERRRDPSVSERQDILSLLILARFEDGSAMDDRELRDQLMTLLVVLC
jgi:Cytochrome P450